MHKLAPIFGRRESISIIQILFDDLLEISYRDKAKKFPIDLTALYVGALERLVKGEPVQYITGIAYFYGLKFKVTTDVLIPRSETEELIWHTIKLPIFRNNSSLRILDVGTGSGCIAIVLKKKIPNAEVVAIDISNQALDVAIANALVLNADIRFVNADISTVQTLERLGSFDLIVSNPPYVGREEKDVISAGTSFEPELALYPPTGDPIYYYRKIFDLCNDRLACKGWLAVELNEFSAEKILRISQQYDFLTEQEILLDMQGKKRFLITQRK